MVASAIAMAAGLAYATGETPQQEGKADTSAPAPAGPSVPVAEVITRVIAPSAEFTGFLAAPRTVELRSRVGGTVDAVSVPEGSLVRQGQPLFQIDPRPFQVALDTALAQLRQAQALADQAQTDFDRAERLVSTGAVSRKVHDEAASTRRARLAQVQVAKAAVAAARLDLSYARITAPIAGRVDRVMVTEGNLVSGGTAGGATLLTTIVSIDPMHVYFDVDEATYLNAVRQARPDAREASALPVDVGLVTDRAFPIGAASISSATRWTVAPAPSASALSSPTRMASWPRPVRPRQAGHRRTARDRPGERAGGGHRPGKNYVLVVGADNLAGYRPVELGRMVDGLRVIQSGLRAGERIIIKGLVRPGMAVTPRLVPMEPAAAAPEARRQAGAAASDAAAATETGQ
ncbi:efflux RND transporter periplasmic adaptor subunit [Achromobacter xylosoxidans]